MKSRVISLSRWSDGAHHSSPTPQISLYLSSALIQQNNSPKSLSIFHTLLPRPPLCISFYFAMLKAEAYALCLAMLCCGPYTINTHRGWTERAKWKKRADNVYTQVYLLAAFYVSDSESALGGMVSPDISGKK